MTKIAWNKGLTKETDARVAKYTTTMRISKRGVSVRHDKQFKKGFVPWNKGMIYTPEYRSKMNTSGLAFGRGLFKGKLKRKNYANLHYWVRTNKGKAIICTKCGHNGNSGTRCEWANVDHKYSTNLNDYISLCRTCHHAHDKMLQ